jgi:hypothetical protein
VRRSKSKQAKRCGKDERSAGKKVGWKAHPPFADETENKNGQRMPHQILNGGLPPAKGIDGNSVPKSVRAKRAKDDRKACQCSAKGDQWPLGRLGLRVHSVPL